MQQNSHGLRLGNKRERREAKPRMTIWRGNVHCYIVMDSPVTRMSNVPAINRQDVKIVQDIPGNNNEVITSC